MEKMREDLKIGEKTLIYCTDVLSADEVLVIAHKLGYHKLGEESFCSILANCDGRLVCYAPLNRCFVAIDRFDEDKMMSSGQFISIHTPPTEGIKEFEIGDAVFRICDDKVAEGIVIGKIRSQVAILNEKGEVIGCNDDISYRTTIPVPRTMIREATFSADYFYRTKAELLESL